jgi:hypothetical protein
MKRGSLFAWALFSCVGLSALSTRAAEPEAAGTLQSPADASQRNSAYSLPSGRWAFDVGVLGVGSDDLFAKLGVAYGIGAGVQAELNAAHVGIGIINVTARWQFVDTRYFDLGASAGAWYGRGEWLWILQGPTKELVSHVSMLRVPLSLTASTQPTSLLEFDLGVEYGYANLFGSLSGEESFFVDAQLAVQHFNLRPGMRVFVSDATALEMLANLPPYTAIPRDGEDRTIPFSETWSLEAGIRSRFAEGLFGTLRMHYGKIAEILYDARLYPSFEVEARF